MADDNNVQVKPEEEMTEEERTALQESENFILNFKDEDMEDEGKRDALQKALKNAQTTVHQKKHYREKVGELTTELKKYTKDGDGNGNSSTPAPVASPEAPASTAMIEFRQDHPTLTKEAVKEIFAYAAANKTTPDEALKSPVIAAYLKSLDTKADVEDASVEPAAPAGSDIGKRDWSRATPKEIEQQRAAVMNGGQ